VSLFTPETLPWAYAVGLLVAGFVLLFLEVFVIPGVNIFGVLGFVSLLTGIVYTYVRLGARAALWLGAGTGLATTLLVWLVLRTRAWQRLVLHRDIASQEGYRAAPADLAELAGRTGEALTPLRPSGNARFGERIVDVVSEGGFIPRGAQVVVLEVVGSRVVVQERTSAPAL
jgi:membrane-bound serine protease (ClpP class)